MNIDQNDFDKIRAKNRVRGIDGAASRNQHQGSINEEESILRNISESIKNRNSTIESHLFEHLFYFQGIKK